MNDGTLLVLPDGRRLGPVEGYLPRLVGFTHEDRAAKGLRKLDGSEAPQSPVHFTPAEMVTLHRAQLLYAPSGGGKSTLAAEFRYSLESEPGRLTSPVGRGPGAARLPQLWGLGVLPVVVSGADDSTDALDRADGVSGRFLLILDDLQRHPDPEGSMMRAMAWLNRGPERRLLILCETSALHMLRCPPGLAVHQLLPVPKTQRAELLAAHGVADPEPTEWMHPGPWSLSLAAGRAGPAWALPHQAGEKSWLDDVRDALKLETVAPGEAAALVAADPLRWAGPLALLGEWQAEGRAAQVPMVNALAETGEPVALLAAARMTEARAASAPKLRAGLVRVIEAGGCAPGLRRALGEALSRLGDPRDFDDLVDIPAGRYPMGGDLHPNSVPAHTVDLPGYRIGRYPVTAMAYLAFVNDTGRAWHSESGRLAERRNTPATDLTWHDARAYCDWLTICWRKDGRISRKAVVRLPSEPEWEAAARGFDGLTWPWGESWSAEHSNGDETGFNDICAVGLFPEGASPFGCLDMAGQAWEWCTTLWGADPAAPWFRYPWADDGREDPDAGPEVRRVLRGGCFSSPENKANGIYRGSLEPRGSWRGNGFRIVVRKRDEP